MIVALRFQISAYCIHISTIDFLALSIFRLRWFVLFLWMLYLVKKRQHFTKDQTQLMPNLDLLKIMKKEKLIKLF